MASVSFEAEARRSFPTGGFATTGALLGAVHHFEFEGCKIELRLPRQSPDNAPESARETTFSSSMKDDPDNPETTTHEILKVALRTNVARPLSIDEQAFEHPPNWLGATQNEADQLYGATDEYAALLFRAWEYWQSVARWVSGRSGIGQSSAIVGKDPYGGLTDLFRKEDGRKIWLQSGYITALGLTVFDRERWELLQEVLSTNEGAPIWFNFLAEAEERLKTFDLQGSVISAAIACETMIRSVFWLSVPGVSIAAARQIIDAANVRNILSRWRDLALITKTEAKALQLELIHKLFDVRNELMHLGNFALADQEASKLVRAARSFLESADALFRQRQGRTDWRERFRAIEKNPNLPPSLR